MPLCRKTSSVRPQRASPGTAEEVTNMYSFVATNVRQSAAADIAVGPLVTLAHGMVQYAKLRHAMTLNIVP